MLTRRALRSSATAFLVLSLAAPAFAKSDNPIPVVATFSILGDMGKRIGGEHVSVTTLVGPDGDTHVHQPTLPMRGPSAKRRSLSEAPAKDVVRLIQQIRERGIRAVFMENIGDPHLLRRIADETGAVIGGTLYPGALSGPDGPAPTYLDLMRHNATTLAQALAS